MQTHLDHLVIGAATLEQGINYVYQELGVKMPRGGRHIKMGTHNCLMNLGDGTYLEIISIDPEASEPKRPRWFGLDDPLIRRQLEQSPRLLTWVVNTDDLTAILGNSPISFGRAEAMERDGLRWQIGIPSDGRLLAGGVLPYLINWQTPRHPASSMADTGCRLKKLVLYTSRLSWTRQQLGNIGSESLVKLEPSAANSSFCLEAHIATPEGLKVLRSL